VRLPRVSLKFQPGPGSTGRTRGSPASQQSCRSGRSLRVRLKFKFAGGWRGRSEAPSQAATHWQPGPGSVTPVTAEQPATVTVSLPRRAGAPKAHRHCQAACIARIVQASRLR
jgi:hypothetical protein